MGSVGIAAITCRRVRSVTVRGWMVTVAPSVRSVATAAVTAGSGGVPVTG